MEQSPRTGTDHRDDVWQAPVFLTGGSGFVGGAVVEHLVAAEAEVRALVRSEASANAVSARGAVPVPGRLSDSDVLTAAMSGCEVVFHVAGVNTMCPHDPGVMYRTNVDDVRTVVDAAADAGARRIVLTSSAAAIGEPEGAIADECTQHTGSFLSHYARSKFLGERAFFETAAQRGIEGIAVNPSSVQGPGRAGGSTLLMRYALSARRPFAIETTLSIVDVDDCARGHLLAAIRGSAGTRYLISGASITLAEAVALLAEIADRPIEPAMVPRSLVALAYPLVAAAGLVVGDVPICGEILRTLLHGHRFDASRSIDDLGISYIPISETFARTYAWLAEEGFVAG